MSLLGYTEDITGERLYPLAHHSSTVATYQTKASDIN